MNFFRDNGLMWISKGAGFAWSPARRKTEKGEISPLHRSSELFLNGNAPARQAVEKATGQIIPWVFHRNGKPIKDFYETWRKATGEAGVSGSGFFTTSEERRSGIWKEQVCRDQMPWRWWAIGLSLSTAATPLAMRLRSKRAEPSYLTSTRQSGKPIGRFHPLRTGKNVSEVCANRLAFEIHLCEYSRKALSW